MMVSSGYSPLATNVLEDREITEVPETIRVGSIAGFGLELDNTRNDRDSFFKMWMRSTTPDVGNTVPDWVFRIRAGKRLGFPFRSDASGSFVFLPLFPVGTGLFVACVTTGGTEGKTPPAQPVFLTLKVD